MSMLNSASSAWIVESMCMCSFMDKTCDDGRGTKQSSEWCLARAGVNPNPGDFAECTAHFALCSFGREKQRLAHLEMCLHSCTVKVHTVKAKEAKGLH
eukprot:5026887-Amphidinium_carterae.1